MLDVRRSPISIRWVDKQSARVQLLGIGVDAGGKDLLDFLCELEGLASVCVRGYFGGPNLSMPAMVKRQAMQTR